MSAPGRKPGLWAVWEIGDSWKVLGAWRSGSRFSKPCGRLWETPLSKTSLEYRGWRRFP
jgi:hypothetical protein